MSGSRIRLYGSTSGYVELEAPAVAPDGVLTLPTGTGGFGKTLQVVQTVKTDTFSTTSTTQTAVTGLSAAITPSSATSKVLVIAQVTVGASDIVGLTLSGGNAGTYIGDTAGSRTRVIGAIQATSAGNGFNPANSLFLQTAVFLDSPATTSAVTYQVNIGTRGVGTAYVNSSSTDTDLSTFHRGSSSITVMEVAA